MPNWKKYLKWLSWIIGFVLLSADRLSNMIGKSTTPEDARSLLDKLGKFLDWLTVHDSVWVLIVGVGLLAVSSALIYADLRNYLSSSAEKKEKPIKGKEVESEINSDFIPTKDQGFYRATVTQTPPRPFSSGRVYISQIFVEARDLRTDLYLRFDMRGINSTGAAIKIIGLYGVFEWEDGAVPDGILDPPPSPPHLLLDQMAKSIPDHSEFQIAIEQRFTKKMATQVADSIETHGGLQIDLQKLKIEASRLGTNENFVLSNWANITVRKSDSILQISRGIMAVGHATISRASRRSLQ